MKEIAIMIICIIMVIVGANFSLDYLSNTGKTLIDDLNELKIEIEKAKNSEENNAKELADNIYAQWEDLEKGWSIIVVHNELDLIQLSLTGMKSYISEGKYSESIEELEKSIFLLEHIQDKEKLDLKNVF